MLEKKHCLNFLKMKLRMIDISQSIRIRLKSSLSSKDFLQLQQSRKIGHKCISVQNRIGAVWIPGLAIQNFFQELQEPQCLCFQKSEKQSNVQFIDWRKSQDLQKTWLFFHRHFNHRQFNPICIHRKFQWNKTLQASIHSTSSVNSSEF